MAEHISQNVCLFCLNKFNTGDIHENYGEHSSASQSQIQIQQKLSPLPLESLNLLRCQLSGKYGERKTLYERFLQFISRYFKLENTSKAFAQGAHRHANERVQVFCKSCWSLVGQICDLYAELNVLELQLLGKISRLEEVMKKSKNCVSSKMEKLLMQTLVRQLNVQQQSQIETLRNRIAIKCLLKTKSPVVQLDRVPRPVEIGDKDSTVMKNQLIALIVVYSLGYYRRTFKFPRLKKNNEIQQKNVVSVISPLPGENDNVKIELVNVAHIKMEKSTIDDNFEECKLSKPEEGLVFNTVEESLISDVDGDDHDFQNDMECDRSESNSAIGTCNSLQPSADTLVENNQYIEKLKNRRTSNRVVIASKQRFYQEEESDDESSTELSNYNLLCVKKTYSKHQNSLNSKLKRPIKVEDEWTCKTNDSAKKIRFNRVNKCYRYTCDVCQTELIGKRRFLNHLESHEIDGKKIACIFCYKQTCSPQLMEFHMKLRHLRKEILCEFDSCRQKFEYIVDLNEHLKVHMVEHPKPASETKVKTSADCETLELENVQNHDADLNSKKSFDILKCSTCGWGFLNPLRLELHEVCHTIPFSTVGMDKYKCPKCNQEKQGLSQLMYHYNMSHEIKANIKKSNHETMDIFKCTVCEEIYHSKRRLDIHFRSHDIYTKSSNYPKLEPKASPGPAQVLCPLCDKYFDHNCKVDSLALIHMKTAHETSDKSIHCAFCDKSFTHKLTRDLHTQCVEHFESEMRCVCNYETCCEKFDTVEQLNEHLETHREACNWTAKTEIFYCKLCDWGYFDRSLLELHELVHIPKSNRLCSQCPQKFSTLEPLQLHYQRKHLKGPKVRMKKCTICGLSFINRESLLHHHKKNHTKVFKCTINSKCSYFTWNKERLQNHEKDHKRSVLECAECDIRFDTKDTLNAHMYTKHNVGDGHQCPVCGKIHPTANRLAFHMHCHNEPRYKCDICHRKFKRREHLKDHKVTHSAERLPQFVCTECGKGYMTQEGLKCHISGVHTPASEHKFKCPHCSKVFHRNMLLKLHMKTHK